MTAPLLSVTVPCKIAPTFEDCARVLFAQMKGRSGKRAAARAHQPEEERRVRIIRAPAVREITNVEAPRPAICTGPDAQPRGLTERVRELPKFGVLEPEDLREWERRRRSWVRPQREV